MWLAYWFFYFYNDYNLIGPFIKAGLHEGDWEMIQLRLDRPAPCRTWRSTPSTHTPDSAPGTRSSAWAISRSCTPLEAPTRRTLSAGAHWTGAWFDFADGKRPAPPLTLEILSDVAGVDGWAVWPGMWGGTTPPPGDTNPLDDSSPRGPGGHAQYKNPDVLLATAVAYEAALAAAPRRPHRLRPPCLPPPWATTFRSPTTRIPSRRPVWWSR